MSMNRSVILIVMVLWLFVGLLGCADNGDNENQESNQVYNYIDGTWFFEYPTTDCVETYIFEVDMSFTITSAEEIQTGTYTFNEMVEEGQRHEMHMFFESDNGMPSCSGNTSDSTGEAYTLYLEFKNDLEADFYPNATGGDALITLTREN